MNTQDYREGEIIYNLHLPISIPIHLQVYNQQNPNPQSSTLPPSTKRNPTPTPPSLPPHDYSPCPDSSDSPACSRP